jgi:lysozyme
MKKLSKRGLQFIKEAEGLRLESYRCSGNVWTIGYGSTDGVTQGMKISNVEAENRLKRDVKRFEDAVNSLVNVDLTQSQYDALVSFSFNVGVAAFKNSTMLKLINKGQLDKVPNEFSKWIFAGKKKVNGLVARRAKEAALFVDDAWEADDQPSPAYDARRAVPKIITKENMAFATGIIGSSGVSVDALITGNSPVNYAIAAGIIAALVVGLVLFFKRRGS